MFDIGAPAPTLTRPLLEAARSASIIVAFAGIATAVSAVLSARKASNKEASLAVRRTEVEKKSTEMPADPKLAWDLARVTLDEYFYRNLKQVSQIFYTALGVMLAGFGLIIYGAILAIHPANGGDLPGKLTVLSGIITEFISVTFMVVYKSTLQQANSYMAVLEKINAVGMAVQIIETIPESDPLYAETRSDMARALLNQFKSAPKYERQPQAKSSPKPRKKSGDIV